MINVGASTITSHLTPAEGHYAPDLTLTFYATRRSCLGLRVASSAALQNDMGKTWEGRDGERKPRAYEEQKEKDKRQ